MEVVAAITGEDPKEVNRMLLEEFGYFEASEKPLFRAILVTRSLTEVRSGVHDEFSGDLFLRTTIGTMEVEKYNYLDNHWVLERQFGTNGNQVVKGDGYEPLYVFRNLSKGFERLPLKYKVCKLVALASLVAKPKKNAKMIESEEESNRQRVYDKRMDVLQQEFSFLSHQFHHGEAVVLGGAGNEASILPDSPNLRGDVK